MKWFDDIPAGWFVLALGAILFLPFLGNVHLFDWDEINFAESAREMLETGNYLLVQINYQPFAEKPPLFFWMQAGAMHLFGVNEFSARLPNALIGMVTLWVVFRIGTRLHSRGFGVVWSLLYAASFLPHLYFKSGIIDPTFNLFIFLGVDFASRLTAPDEFSPPKVRRRHRRQAVVAAGVFVGLAVLTKGPVGLLLFTLTYLAYYVFDRFRRMNTIGELVLFVVVVAFTTSIWYGTITWLHGPDFLRGFIQRHLELAGTEDAGHGGPFYYHLIVLLLGCFPASVLMFNGLRRRDDTRTGVRLAQRWMLCLLLVVVVIFSIVQTKIIHYSSLAYLPLTFFAAVSVHGMLTRRIAWSWYHALMLLVIGIAWGLAAVVAPFVGMNPDAVIPLIDDPFARANLEATVHWSFRDMLVGALFILALVAVAVTAGFGHVRTAFAVLIIACLLFVQSLLYFFVPRIERYTQRAAIEFFESKQDEDCYIGVLGYKSYAPYFYARHRMLPNERLLTEDLALPVYFVTRVDRLDHWQQAHPDLVEIDRRNGFVFLTRSEADAAD